MISKDQILDALKNIIDPDFNKDIVTLGFVKNIQINESSVSLDIELTTPACPIKEEFKNKAQQALQQIPGIKEINIRMTAQEARPAGKQLSEQSTLKDVREIIAISSCKGGVGKSTVSAQLAMELARRGFRVGLIDADIYGPSIPTLFDLHNISVQVNDKKQLIPVVINGLKIMSFGFLLGGAPAVLRGPMVTNYVQQLFHMTDWGTLDYLFVDMPPGTGDIQLTISQSIQLSGAVIVTTRQSLAMVDVARGILMFEKVNIPILGIIENMAYFQCDECDKKHHLFGKNTVETLHERFGIATLAEIPILNTFSNNIDPKKSNPFFEDAIDKVIRSLGKSSLAQQEIPKIDSQGEKLILTYPDQHQIAVSHRALRLSCRCAICVDEHTGKQILKEEDVPQNIAPKEVMPLGNYAIGITWNDGHSTGIHPYKNIEELAKA